MLEMTESGSGFYWALVYQWHWQFVNDSSSQYRTWGGSTPTIINKSLMSDVISAQRKDACMTLRDIAHELDIGVATVLQHTRYIQTEKLNMECVCPH